MDNGSQASCLEATCLQRSPKSTAIRKAFTIKTSLARAGVWRDFLTLANFPPAVFYFGFDGVSDASMTTMKKTGTETLSLKSFKL